MPSTWTLTLGPDIQVIDNLGNITDLGNILTDFSYGQPGGTPQLGMDGTLNGKVLSNVGAGGISGFDGLSTLKDVLGDLISRTQPDVVTLTTNEGAGVLQFSDKTFQRMIMFTPTENSTLTLAGGTSGVYREIYLLITMPDTTTDFTIDLPANCTYSAGVPPIATGVGAQTLIKFGAIGSSQYLGGL